MNEHDQPADLVDPSVTALGTLLGPEAEDFLSAVLNPVGGDLESFRVAQVRYVPGSSVTVQYRAAVRWAKQGKTSETLIAMSGLDVPEEVPVFSDGDVRIAFWRYPDDPFLPGLAAAADPHRVGRLLESLGAASGTVRLRRRAYRAGRRAVIEAFTPQSRIFLKIVRPARVEALQRRHVALASQIPVPRSLGWAEDQGLVALQAMPGRTLRKALESGTRRLPEGSKVTALLDSLPDPDASAATRKGPRDRAPAHARLLNSVLPRLTDRVDAIVGRLSETAVDESEVPVHGDFHSSQILVRGNDIVGIIDVDTAGRGHRSDDLAGLLGHLATLSLSTSTRRAIDRYGSELIRDFDVDTDPASVRRTVAAVVLGLATGPFRVQQSRWASETERRISLSERWLDSADAVDG